MASRRIAPLLCALAAAVTLLLLTCRTCEAVPSGDALYRSYRGAIPSNVFERMESDCRAMAEFESRGAALKDGKRVTRWMAVGAFPRTALEEAILHLVRLAKPGPALVGYEWWIQQIGEERPLAFHVDKDESVASNEHYLLHPIWSSVFYVTAEGGGTLITNQYSPHGSGYEPEQPTEAAWSFPAPNKFLVFNGTLLHGVVPGSRRGPLPKERITFLVNFWHVRPKEPNCMTLEHESVPGLTLLSREEILELREQEAAAPSPKPKRQPMANIDLSPGSTTAVIPFRIDLPGGDHQMVNLPDLKVPTTGQTYSLQYQPRAKKAKNPASTGTPASPSPAAAEATPASAPEPEQADAPAASSASERSKQAKRAARKERERREAAEIAAQLEERRLRRQAQEQKEAARRARRQARKQGKPVPVEATTAAAATPAVAATAAAPQKPTANQKQPTAQAAAAPRAEPQQQSSSSKKLSQKEKRAARRAARAARRKQREAEEAAEMGLDAAAPPQPPKGVFSVPSGATAAETPRAAAAKPTVTATTPPPPPPAAAAAAAPAAPAAAPAARRDPTGVLDRLDATRAAKDALRRTLEKQ